MLAEPLHMNHDAYLQMNKKKHYLTGLIYPRCKVGHMTYQICDLLYMNLVGRHQARTGASGFANVTVRCLQQQRPAVLIQHEERTIRDYFQKITDIEDKYGKIPPTQIWNMDEKGIQLGGGRKNGCKKFFFLKKRRNRYKLRNDNLELVTILECVSAAGIAAPTSFVLVNGPYPDI
jgi:hypothetical protein